MNNQVGSGLAVIFAIIGFIIALFDIFSAGSGLQGTTGAWWVGLFTLLSIIFTAWMFIAENMIVPILAIICVIIAGLIAIDLHSWWLLICMIISLIGCIIAMASSGGDLSDE